MEEQFQLKVMHYQRDSYIMLEGQQKADRFFIIQQGKVKISKELKVEGDTEGDKILATGDFFGVISTMSSHSHLESARALTDVVLITVLQSQYGGLIQKKAQVAIKIITQFSKQLRSMNQTLALLTLNNINEAGPSQLFIVAEYFFNSKRYNPAFHAYTQYLKYCPAGDKTAIAKEKLATLRDSVKNIETGFNANDVNRSYEKDSMLFSEGEPGNELFVIQRGSVKIIKIVDNQEVLLAVLKPGDIFGEMALLEDKPRVASALVYERCDVLVITKGNFELMIQSQPQLITKITILLAERLWLVYKKFANTAISNIKARAYDSLLIQLEKNRISQVDINPYTFSFGPGELFNMMGIREADGRSMFKEILNERKITIENDRIHTSSVADLVKQAEYYRKLDRIEKAKRVKQE